MQQNTRSAPPLLSPPILLARLVVLSIFQLSALCVCVDAINDTACTDYRLCYILEICLGMSYMKELIPKENLNVNVK